jgi:ribosomal protein S18 acetylase RimI-like enzyme
MELSLATKKDFEQFLPIKEEFFRDYNISKKSKEFIVNEFEEYLLKGAIVLAIENKKIAGYLAGEIEENSYEKFGYISEVFVKKEYRNKGVSTKLKDKFLDFLRGQHITLCRIDVNPDNLAQEAYKKWGFKIDKYRMSLQL